MRIIRVFFIIGILSGLFLINCTGKESSEEKIKITIEHEDNEGKEFQKEPEKPSEETLAPPKKPEATPQKPIASKTPVELPPKPPLKRGMDFKTVANNLSLDYHTKVAVKDYWQKVEGKPVIWAGEVYEVDKGRRGFKILVDNPALKSRKGFNIVLVGNNKQNIESISSGDHIRFKGILRKFDYGQEGYSPLIVLSDARIL